MSTIRQSTALIRRYVITTLRSPISSIIRALAWPALILGLSIYVLKNLQYPKESPAEHAEFLARFVPFMTLTLTIFQVYHFTNHLVTDRVTGMKSLMISMGLKRRSYYIANSICFIGLTMPPTLIIAGVSLSDLFGLSKSSSFAVMLVFVLFIIHLTGLVFVFASVITSTSIVSLLFIVILLEGLVHSGVYYLTLVSPASFRPVVLFIASLSPYESVRIFIDSFILTKNDGSTAVSGDDADNKSYHEGRVSQPTYLIILALTFWSISAYAFARWFEEVCPWQNDSAIKGPFFCCTSKASEQAKYLKENSRRTSDANFERSISNRDIGIRVCGLTKRFNKIPVVDNVYYNIYKGETTLLLGHNGAGKTTLMNMILGRLTPDDGVVQVNSSSLNNSGSRYIGICPQTSILDDNLSVKQHLELFASIKPAALASSQENEHIKTTIDDVSLTSHMFKLPSELSGGMKRKLSLAMAFVGNSSILILDEPSSGLDPDSRVFIWNAIRRYRTDRTVLLSTQHMEEADYLGDRIAIMSDGKIVCSGSSSYLTNLYGSGYKLRVECHLSKKKQVLSFIRNYFPSAKQSEVDHEDSLHDHKDPVLSTTIELTDSKSKDTETKMISMLEELENRPKELNIVSYGLKSASIEDVMLNTSKSHFRDHSESVNITLTPTGSNLASLGSAPRATKKGFLATQNAFLYAFMAKQCHVYLNDWKSILFYRVALALLGLWFLVDSLNTKVVNLDSFTLSPIYALLIFHFIRYPSVEKVSKFKVMQLTSHTNFVIYWISQILMDLSTIIFQTIAFNIFLALLFKGEYNPSSFNVHLLASVAMILFGLAGAVLAYFLSTIFTDSGKAVGYYSLINGTNVMVYVVVALIGAAFSRSVTHAQKVLRYVFVALLPTTALEYVMYGFVSKCYVKKDSAFNRGVECREVDGVSPVAFGLVALSLQIIVYGFLLYITEKKLYDWSWFCRFQNIFGCLRAPVIRPTIQEADPDVLEESDKALRSIGAPRDNYTLVAADLSKSYIRGANVINHLSFTVQKGECFGLLGVNGAGKSTTFSMLSSDCKQDTGDICLRGQYLSGNVHKYRKLLGYNPQSNPEVLLTPIQSLYLMARLRQVDEASIPALVRSVLERLDMSEHGSKIARDLSGGTQRKLALGMSLIGSPSIIALDEPTAGVDPVARRSIWSLFRVLRSQSGSSIIIASHAMEECEAICDRISIMARGNLRCIGTFLHLRDKFARGCSVKVQFTNNEASKSGSYYTGQLPSYTKLIAELRQRLEIAFGSSIKLSDTNINSATFNVLDNNVKRSSLFKVLREFKQKHSNMSYMINDSSLEDIFISLAREAEELEHIVAVV